MSRSTLSRTAQEKPTALQTFLVNAAGNATSTAILFPLILSKTRLQWRSPSGKRVYRSLADVLRKTVRRNGVQGRFPGPMRISFTASSYKSTIASTGLYQGLESQLLKGLVSHGTTMMVKQRVESLFITLFLVLTQRSGRLSLSSS